MINVCAKDFEMANVSVKEAGMANVCAKDFEMANVSAKETGTANVCAREVGMTGKLKRMADREKRRK